jgi:arylsulfatase A-like enzyme
MCRILPRKIVAPVVVAAVLTLLLGVAPFIHAARAEFLGKDVSGLAASIVGMYPGYFLRELLAALAVSFITLLPVSGIFYYARTSLGAESWVGRVVFPGGVLFFYVALYLQSLFRYPALYESITPHWLEQVVFSTAGFLSPFIFQLAAMALLIAPLVYVVVRIRADRLRATALTLAVMIAWWAVWATSRPGRLLAAPVQTGAPNILLVSIDSLRSDYIETAMPVVQALRESGETVDFRNHYVGVPRTFPSWVELLYGNYAPTTMVRHMFPGFGQRRQRSRPFPELLRDKGYSTAIISDFAGDIFPRFESGYEQVLAPSMNLRGLIQLAVHQKFLFFLPFTSGGFFSDFFPALTQNPAFADPARLTEKFVSARKSQRPDQPWFVTIFFSTAHFPYATPWPHYRGHTEGSYGGPFYFQKNPEITGGEVLTAENIAQTRGLYRGALNAIDEALGELFAQLRESGEWERTIIVVTGDHGEDLYEHGRLQGHGEHLAGKNVIKVPFLLRVPGADFSARSPVRAVSRSVDVGPTLLGAVGIPWEKVEGHDLYPWVSGAEDAVPDLIAFSETGIWFSATGKGEFQANRLSYPGISGLLSFDHGMSQEVVLNPSFEKIVATAKHRSIVAGDYKLIYSPTETGVKFALYNELSDPDNLTELSGAEPVKLAEMKDLFFATMTRIDPAAKRVGEYFVGP